MRDDLRMSLPIKQRFQDNKAGLLSVISKHQIGGLPNRHRQVLPSSQQGSNILSFNSSRCDNWHQRPSRELVGSVALVDGRSILEFKKARHYSSRILRVVWLGIGVLISQVQLLQQAL